MENSFKKIIEEIGEDINREGLIDTPKRAADALKFMTQGYHQSLEVILNGALFKSESEEMIIVEDIEFFSLCEHHMLPFSGVCHVAYLPKGVIIGLSKIPRIVNMYSRRLQVQERLTQQIADAVLSVTEASGVGVIMEAKHLCMMMRGVEKQAPVMSTSVMMGVFRSDSQTRMEFLMLCKHFK